MKVNKAQLADALGVSEKTLTEWQKEKPPLPVLSAASRRGQANQYLVADVIDWLVQKRVREAGFESARDALYRIQAEEAKLRLAEKKGLLVNVAQLEPALMRQFVAFRVALEARDDKLRDEIETIYGIAIDPELIATHTRDALQELSGLADDGEGGPKTARAAKANDPLSMDDEGDDAASLPADHDINGAE
jgi:hypothetical protein